MIIIIKMHTNNPFWCFSAVYEQSLLDDNSTVPLTLHVTCPQVGHVISLFENEVGNTCRYSSPSLKLQCSPQYIHSVGQFLFSVVKHYRYDNIVLLYTGN